MTLELKMRDLATKMNGWDPQTARSVPEQRAGGNAAETLSTERTES